jgi:hypothetical protein
MYVILEKKMNVMLGEYSKQKAPGRANKERRK